MRWESGECQHILHSRLEADICSRATSAWSGRDPWALLCQAAVRLAATQDPNGISPSGRSETGKVILRHVPQPELGNVLLNDAEDYLCSVEMIMLLMSLGLYFGYT